ncbi:MAG TPA: lipid-binding SYLF domain-containing protein [Parvularculaceae bacterium]|nr:lipid-binding SYLF domain-containing protein [Parvularculaceae bacterium]
MLRKAIWAALALAMSAAFAAAPAAAASKSDKANDLVAKAAESTAYFTEDKAFQPLWDLADTAKAMVVIPSSWHGGFMLGGAGGNAVMVARNDDGSWSQPTFFTIGSVSFGFQAGIEKSEVILLVMTTRGMEHLLSTSVKLGGDISIAAGPIGGGAKAQTTDILAFSRSRGVYGGITLEGAILKTRGDWNDAYYGAHVTPADIIYRQKAYNPASQPLQNAAWALAHKNNPPLIAPIQPVGAASGAPQPLQSQQGASGYEDDDAWSKPAAPSQQPQR